MLHHVGEETEEHIKLVETAPPPLSRIDGDVGDQVSHKENYGVIFGQIRQIMQVNGVMPVTDLGVFDSRYTRPSSR